MNNTPRGFAAISTRVSGTRRMSAFGLGSAGTIEIETDARPDGSGGNASETVIRLIDGQWPSMTIKRTPYLVEMRFHGACELAELIDFFLLLRERDGGAPLGTWCGDGP